MNDVRSRLKWVQRPANNMVIESGQITSYNRISDIKRFVEACYKSNLDVDFHIYCDLLENASKIGTQSEVSSLGDYISENLVHRVRSAKETQTLIKQRMSRLQNKTKPAIEDALDNIMANTDSSNFGAGASVSSSSPSAPQENSKAVEEAYANMLDNLSITMNCDRMLENYNRISKRFNIDRLFIESKLSNEDIVIELCNMVDTYNMHTDIKFNSVIETAMYGFESNKKPYKKSDILETAVNYFLFKEDGLASCKEILDATLFFDKDEDMGDIDVFTEEEPEEQQSVEEAIMLSASTSNNTSLVLESSDFNDIFTKFKKEELGKDGKPENKLKGLVDKLYRKDVNSIIDDTPDLLSWLRKFFVLGSFAINPVLGCVTYIGDKFVTMHYDRTELPKVIKAFNKELKDSREKLKTMDDGESKDKLEQYIKSVEKARDRVNNYYVELLTDKEQDEYYDKMDFDDGKDDDFDFDDFFENNIIAKLGNDMEDFVSIVESGIINEKSMYDLAKKLNKDDISVLSKIASRHPETFYKEAVIDGITSSISRLRSSKSEPGVSSIQASIEICARESALARLKDEQNKNTVVTEEVDVSKTISESEAIREAYHALSIMIDTYNKSNSMLEASFTNSLNVASNKLRNSFADMSDKERAISRNVDLGMNNLKKGIEMAVTNDNRESIIKGSVLPSFSKIIKLCIVNAGLIAFHQPALAVIGTLAYFALNAKVKPKERQMVVDEIEIEIDMCDRYIEDAERRNDMAALRQLLTTKKELERQRQRIKYKMGVKFGQKYYDAKAPMN